MSDAIRYCVTVDTEEEWDWASGYPTGPTSVTNITRLRDFHALCERSGAAVVYFANHAVLKDPPAREVILELSKRPRTEIGLHIHPWNTPPLADAVSVSQRESFLHNLPWPEQRAKLDTVLEAFRDAGLSPTSFRGGRYSTSTEIQNHLRRSGVIADCSVLPWNTWPDDGAPDFRDRDLSPRRLPPNEHSDRAMWELPLTFGCTRTNQQSGAKWLKFADGTLGRVLRLTGLFDRLGFVSRAWLNFENPLGERMLRFLRVLRKLRPPFVSFTLHSSSLLPGGSPYAKTDADVERILRTAKAALETVAAWPEFLPATATEIAHHLEAAHR